MDHYGKLDRNLLEAFMRRNPQVSNWNALDRTVKLTLPELDGVPIDSRQPRVDIHSILVGSFPSRGTASLEAERLNRAGFQNLFVTAETEKPAKGRHYDLCAGVFVSEPAAAATVPWMRQSGFPEARTVRIREASLGQVLHPFRPPPLP
jgi:hypothetical protein